MASYTPNYNLKKPADSDSYDIADENGNMDIIDAALNTLNSKLFKKLSATTDLNNISEDGVYLMDWVSGGTSYHRPNNQGGILISCMSTSGLNPAKEQLLVTYSGAVWSRGHENNGWNGWRPISTTKSVNMSVQTGFSLESWGSINAYVSGGLLVINVSGLKSTNTLSVDTVALKMTNITYTREGNAYGVVWNGSSKVGNASIFDNNGNIYLNRVDGNNVCFFNLVLPLSAYSIT